jgi:hypothetical protein
MYVVKHIFKRNTKVTSRSTFQALALKTAASRKTVYDRTLFTVEKLIDLEPSATVKDICLKLGISHLTKDAETLKSNFEAQTDIDDVNHPMYAVGAVWIIAKYI